MANLAKTETALIVRVAQLQAQVSSLNEKIKSLGSEKESIISEKKRELDEVEKKLSERKFHVIEMGKKVAELDKRIFEADLRLATWKAQEESVRAEIVAAQKYYDYLNSLVHERNHDAEGLEVRITKLEEDEKRLSLYAKRIDLAVFELAEINDKIYAMQGELKSFHVVQGIFLEEKKVWEDKKEQERQKLDSYYNEIKEIEKTVKTEKENVRQQAMTMAGRSIIKLVKKSNGSL